MDLGQQHPKIWASSTLREPGLAAPQDLHQQHPERTWASSTLRGPDRPQPSPAPLEPKGLIPARFQQPPGLCSLLLGRCVATLPCCSFPHLCCPQPVLAITGDTEGDKAVAPHTGVVPLLWDPPKSSSNSPNPPPHPQILLRVCCDPQSVAPVISQSSRTDLAPATTFTRLC